MTYLFSSLFWWILAALIAGFVAGWFTWTRENGIDWMSGWLRWALVAFILGLILVLLNILPGRLGLWLESALFLFASYIIGCLLGVWLKGLQAGAPAASGVAAVPATATEKAVAEKPPAEPVAPTYPGVRPAGIAAPEGPADNLKFIKGIGPANEKILNDLGIFHFCQISGWTPENAVWVGHHLAFPGRIEREHWISQANLLCAGLDTEHSYGVKSGAIKVDEAADAPLSEAEARALHASLPQVAAAVEGEGDHAGKRPLGLVAPRGSKADDLKLIKGIGKQNEARLHGLGVWHFDQIAAWTQEEVQWVGSYLAFPGRIDREQWVAQAKVLAAGGTTEFAKRAERGEVASSKDDGGHGADNVQKVDQKH
jgi:predicted flap endonuclease-1-like 5' DNA nuclease